MGATGIHVVRGDNNSGLRPIPIAGGVNRQNYAETARNLDHEQFVMFDSAGNPIKGFDGDRHSVAVDQATLNLNGDGYHNHPDRGWGGTLSMTDVQTFARSQMNSLTAVGGQGQFYTIRDNGNGDRAALSRWANSQGKLLNKNFQSSYRRQLRNLTTPLRTGPHKGQVKVQVQKRVNGKLVTQTTYRAPMNAQQADKLARQISTGMYARAYEKALQRYGFSYVTGKSRNL